jgi:hypothetical protein
MINSNAMVLTVAFFIIYTHKFVLSVYKLIFTLPILKATWAATSITIEAAAFTTEW